MQSYSQTNDTINSDKCSSLWKVVRYVKKRKKCGPYNPGLREGEANHSLGFHAIFMGEINRETSRSMTVKLYKQILSEDGAGVLRFLDQT